MEYTIYSRKFSHNVSFSRPGTGYIYVDLSEKQNHHGTLGNQICYGGDLIGSTITYRGDDYDGFERVCKNWWKQYLKHYPQL